MLSNDERRTTNDERRTTNRQAAALVRRLAGRIELGRLHGTSLRTSPVGKGSGMLSEAEQRRLTEIERGLRSDDPEFASRFGDVVQSRPYRWCGMTARAWLIAAALIMGLAILTASLGVALIAVSVAGVSAAMWLTGDSLSPDDHRPPQT
jgi:hypothetical protein